jgi:hypothetical protein
MLAGQLISPGKSLHLQDRMLNSRLSYIFVISFILTDVLHTNVQVIADYLYLKL